MKHQEIRAAILSAMKENITERVTCFDGRPAFIDEQELPAVAVYLTDASVSDENIDENLWEAVLHVEVFLRAKETDTALDSIVENTVIPAMRNIPELDNLLSYMQLQGYDYIRDDEFMMWGSVDLRWTIRYEL